ncbi:MFS transporter [Streptomyces decoyicus]|uniref:MFS transporter n=1 Tax=Streptomyces decoyicus TaxID=249567 RepID=UPI0033A049C2
MIAATATYRRVMALSGPVLPVISFLGRLPTAMCQLGSLLLVARTSGSLATAGLVGGALAAGQTVGGPLLGRLADRHGQRTVVLAACWFDACAVAALVAAALARAMTAARPSTTGAPRSTVAADGPPVPAPDGRRSKAPEVRAARARMPRAVHGMRASMALQGVIFGACQSGITALTERLHQPAQAGLVYAAMGVMSAVAGLSLALVPARITLPTRWRAAAVALVVLSVPLLFVRSLWALYPAVVVLGAAFAPHLITLFGLTERLVPAGRLAESMAFLTSAVVGGQALALAAAGRLAEVHGPSAAFAVAVGAAVLILCLALGATARRWAATLTPAAATPAGSGR